MKEYIQVKRENNLNNQAIINADEEKIRMEKEDKNDNVLKKFNNDFIIQKLKEDEINLLHDYTLGVIEEYKKLYIEGKNNINENNIDIYINDKKIKFNYKYKSKEKGNIQVKFVFKKLLTSTAYMFCGCSSLQSINSSSFNTTNVKDMSEMFYKCSSLQSIDLSTFNTTNVKDMSEMFFGCYSLKKENVKIIRKIM